MLEQVIPIWWLPAAAAASGVAVWLVARARLVRESAARDEARRDAGDLRRRLDEASGALERERESAGRIREEAAALRASLDASARHQAEREGMLREIDTRFTDAFKALSADALQVSEKRFLDLATRSLGAREQAVEAMVKPIRESLDKVDQRIIEIERGRQSAYGALREQVDRLREMGTGLQRETGQLVRALRQPVGRGQWGEMQLRRVVELAGMQEHCDFQTQVSSTDEDGQRLRPDMVVRLPNGRSIVVDAKAPMEAFLSAVEATDDEERERQLERHSRHVRTHIQQLSSKNYTSRMDDSVDFVVLFLPAESFFSAALAKDPTLIEQGVQDKVLVATPTTLIALLKAVAHGWRQEALEENARLIAEAGRDLYDRVGVIADHLAKMGRSLNQTVDHFNRLSSSFERRLLPGARRFETLGAASPNPRLDQVGPINALASGVESGEGNGAGDGAGAPEPSDADPADDAGKEQSA